MFQLPPVEKIKTILQGCRRIAVVGLSPKAQRPSNQVAVYLLQAGYEVIPVNPGFAEILGRPCYPDLQSVPGAIDMVDIFRRPEEVLPVVQAAIAKKVRVVWMQEGIVNEEAAELAERQGLVVIMDRCVKSDHQQFMG
jgi:predicted CoA-binding protein